MDRISRRWFLGVIASSLVVPRNVSAQPADAGELLQNLPGLETAYARRYAPADAGAAMLSGDWPVEPSESTPQYLLVMVLTFSNALVVQGLVSTMLSADVAATVMERSSENLHQHTNPELPEGNLLFAGVDSDERYPYGSLLVMPIGADVYLVQAEGDTDAVQATADAIAGYITDSPPAESEVIVVHEGVARGGPFAALPDGEDAELLNGLYPFSDYDLLVSDSPIVATAGTPAASPAATPQSSEAVTVTMTDEAQFDPKDLVISVGTTVEWENASQIQHTATCDPEQNPFKKTRPELIALPDDAEPWGSELLDPGETFSHTFNVAGDYRYICFPHVLSGMEGTIRVDE